MNSLPSPPPFPDPTVPSVEKGFLKLGVMGKCVSILLLVVLLQIPLLMIGSLSGEREGRRNEAVADISKRWGGEQLLVGPILVVPFTFEQTTTQDGSQGPRQLRRICRATAYFLPDTLDVNSTLEPETRRRGIYDAVVYTSRIQIKGRFAAPDLRQVGVVPQEILWDEARVMLCLSDVQGLRSAPEWNWAGRKLTWQPGTRWGELKQGLHAVLPQLNPKTEYNEFDISLELNGSGSLSCVPLGRHSAVSMKSPWADPSFTGAYLPDRRRVDASGFEADWNLSHLARGLPQFWADNTGVDTPKAGEFTSCTIGVSLAHSVDSYRTMDRALKHGILFLALIFTAFFVFEMSSVPCLSALHYALVGGALCLFYLSLLSLSEFLGFSAAYAISAAASTVLISLYSSAILRSGARALLILGGLILVYGYLYFVLQMQDYALLAGTAALFVALGSIMWVTRRIRWKMTNDESTLGAPVVDSE